METVPDTRLSAAKIRSIAGDPEKSAAAARLVYVSDSEPGIRRVKKGRGFVYLLEEKRIADPAMLQRIKKLVIPPAWENVWICRFGNGHLQATGLDVKRRKQYKYHPLWNSVRTHTKFYRMYEFGRALPAIRKRVDKDLNRRGLCREKVLAAVIRLMETTGMRVGSTLYEKLYGSFGLTTLKDKHVAVNGHGLFFLFRGKKGVLQKVNIRSARLARIVKQCRDIPGKELFQYIDESGERQQVDSGMVNDYIRQVAGFGFTAKDFRTWCGTLVALRCFAEAEAHEGTTARKREINAVLDKVAARLGNSRSICRKYYVHPLLLNMYESGRLAPCLAGARLSQSTDNERLEKTLLNILSRERMAA